MPTTLAQKLYLRCYTVKKEKFQLDNIQGRGQLLRAGAMTELARGGLLDATGGKVRRLGGSPPEDPFTASEPCSRSGCPPDHPQGPLSPHVVAGSFPQVVLGWDEADQFSGAEGRMQVRTPIDAMSCPGGPHRGGFLSWRIAPARRGLSCTGTAGQRFAEAHTRQRDKPATSAGGRTDRK
ncbi:hypothetical protein AB0G71_15580 [Streptomyces sp. NPDC020403]|uniref:hypothetical protein n=1 Tax=unclassified Streptomyces TaxID=2593676 RepID=UPI0033FCBC2B